MLHHEYWAFDVRGDDSAGSLRGFLGTLPVRLGMRHCNAPNESLTHPVLGDVEEGTSVRFKGELSNQALRE